MALTVTKLNTDATRSFLGGSKDFTVYTVAFDNNYPTAGEPLTAATLGARALFAVIPLGAFRNTDATLGIVVSYDHANSKLVAYWGNAGSVSGMPEVADTTDLSTYSGRVLVIGR